MSTFGCLCIFEHPFTTTVWDRPFIFIPKVMLIYTSALQYARFQVNFKTWLVQPWVSSGRRTDMSVIMFQVSLYNVIVQSDYGGAAFGPGLDGALPADPVLGVSHAALREPVSLHHQHVCAAIRLYSGNWKPHTCQLTRLRIHSLDQSFYLIFIRNSNGTQMVFLTFSGYLCLSRLYYLTDPASNTWECTAFITLRQKKLVLMWQITLAFIPK